MNQQFNYKKIDTYIKEYYKRLQQYVTVKAMTESTVETAMKFLLSKVAEDNNLILVKPSYKRNDKRIIYDGVIKNVDGWDLGYWEAKDSKDDLEKEIHIKIEKGYSRKNILFENTQVAIIYQNGQQLGRWDITKDDNLEKVIITFFEYDASIYDRFRQEKEKFQKLIPEISGYIFDQLEERKDKSKEFKKALIEFHDQCKAVLNPVVTIEDVERMLVQHILTEDIFKKIIDNEDYFKYNDIAKSINETLKHFYTREIKIELNKEISPYTQTISDLAYQMPDWTEKQKLLNEVYELFFKGFSEKEADRLGIVYTPPEVVDFMIESVNDALQKEFNKTLASKNVHILDPCVGTGTFIVHLLNKIAEIDVSALKHKYENEIHCNEIMLMPYYIASINIEKAYEEITGEFNEYKRICLADTLELTELEGTQLPLFGDKNVTRVKEQTEKDIFVIIGNPPYNKSQENEAQLNKNKYHKEITKKIQETYVKDGKATLKNALYDPYVQFFRWSTSRISKKNGIVCFVSNNGFIHGFAFDGFRKHLYKDFNKVYHLDLRGNARTMGDKRKKEAGNLFHDKIKVGIGITLLIRNEKNNNKLLLYYACDDYLKSEEKLELVLKLERFEHVELKDLKPNKKHNWFSEKLGGGFDNFLQIAERKNDNTIFDLFSNGVMTARDNLVYNYKRKTLENSVKKLIEAYNQDRVRWTKLSENLKKNTNIDFFVRNIEDVIKWERELKKRVKQNKIINYNDDYIITSLYRPFTTKYLYFNSDLNNCTYQLKKILPSNDKPNILICFSGAAHKKNFGALVTNSVPCFDTIEKTQTMPLNKYNKDGTNKRDNITDWSLNEFQTHYKTKDITKEHIFYYIYALLHLDWYRNTFKENLKIELPRIPMLDLDFFKMSDLGKELADVHLNYETADEYEGLTVKTKSKPINYAIERMRFDKKEPLKLIYNPTIEITGFPEYIHDYKVGNRSPIAWVVDQYKQWEDKDNPTYVIDLIKKLITVTKRSINLIKDINGMKKG